VFLSKAQRKGIVGKVEEEGKRSCGDDDIVELGRVKKTNRKVDYS
jgi:hypothetical protein